MAALLAPHDIEVSVQAPAGSSFEDVVHEEVPTGATPPNRSWTVDSIFTHPGDSYQPVATGPVLALPLIAPWGSTTLSVAFARRVRPRYVIPIHDFYLSPSGRQFIVGMASRVLAPEGIEVIPLDWGESASI